MRATRRAIATAAGRDVELQPRVEIGLSEDYNVRLSHLVWSEVLDDAGENGFATHRDCKVVQRFAEPG